MKYPILSSPIKLGNVEVKNRIVFAAHLTNYAEEQMPSERHVAYYRARARGGAGLIITEEHSTHPTDWPYEKLIAGFRSEAVQGYRRITDAVHEFDCKIFAQINHNGGQGSGRYSGREVWGPSPTLDPLFKEVAHEVDDGEIDEIVKGYEIVAENVVAGGFDGIELQCSHSSIVRAFLSSATNHRSDQYGGSLMNRSRLLLRIIEGVRRVIGSDLALGVRLCGDELIEGGITIDETVEVASTIEATAMVDYINTSIGVATYSLYAIEASMAVPPSYSLFIPNAIRQRVTIPVIGVGRFKDPLQCEKALSNGDCDLIGVVRGQIADPDFARKSLYQDETNSIRTCLSCNQECVGRMGVNRWLGCIENRSAGREFLVETEAEPTIRLKPKAGLRSQQRAKVAIAGGGPAGLSATVALARMGYLVAPFEASDEVGGAVTAAAKGPSRAEFYDLIRNLSRELSKVKITYNLETKVDRDLLTELSPDVLIVATGSQKKKPYYVPAYSDPNFIHQSGGGALAIDELKIFDSYDAFAGLRDVKEGERVVIFDEVGFHDATSSALFALERGASVTFITPALSAASGISLTLDLEWWRIKMAKGGAEIVKNTIITAIDGNSISTVNHINGVASQIEADYLILSTARLPLNDLSKIAKELSIPSIRVGDSLAPRRAHSAIIEGSDVVGAVERILRGT